MRTPPYRLASALALAATVLASAPGFGHPTKADQRLSRIGPAADFTLTTQDGGRLSLKDLRGKVVAVTFIYTGCADTCPLLTAKLAAIGGRLGTAVGRTVQFVAISVDPERDTPDILKHYAGRHGVDARGWAFLTGSPLEVREVARRYGVYYRQSERGDVDHTFLTSLIDQRGILRVQYLGVRFDPDEMLRDLQSIIEERVAR
jgi:protein SCO1/2